MSENHQQNSTDLPSPRTQTWVHVGGAVTIAILVALALMLARVYGHTQRGQQQRMIQSVAITDLQLLFDQEKIFHDLHGFYTTDLNQLGIAPKRVLYKFGFVQASSEVHEGVDPTVKDLDILKIKFPKLEMELSPVTQLNTISFERLGRECPDCTATTSTFKAIAAAQLDLDEDLDIWTVDQDGHVVHVHDDFNKSAAPVTTMIKRRLKADLQ